jgi:hypothetical protein
MQGSDEYSRETEEGKAIMNGEDAKCGYMYIRGNNMKGKGTY